MSIIFMMNTSVPADADEDSMTDNRFADLPPTSAPMTPSPTAGFLVIPFAASDVAQVSSLQWLYQKVYEQAAQAIQQPKTRDLFAIMN
jgi:hypothetical protein